MENKNYAISKETTLPHDEALQRARELLAERGYGILAEIDVQAKLQEKLGVEREPYTILGACNPPLAGQGLDAEPDLGVLLPCNVVVYERDGATHISAVEPATMLGVVGNASLDPIADRVRRDLTEVVEAVARG